MVRSLGREAWVAALVAAAMVAACGSSDSAGHSTDSSGADAPADVSLDASAAAPADVSLDAPADAPADASAAAPADVPGDVPGQVLTDALTDEQAVASDRAELALTLAAGDTPDEVTRSFVVPLAGAAGSTISWQSDDAAIAIDQAGNATVTRPDSQEEDVAVTLTAHVAKGAASDERDFELTVVRRGHSSAEEAAAVAADKAALSLSLGRNESADAIRYDFTVPVFGTSGSTITWTGSDPAIVVAASGDALVTRPTAGDDVELTLTATLTYGKVTDTRDFVVTVVEGSFATRVAEDDAWLHANLEEFLAGDAPFVEGLLTYYPVHADFTLPLVGPSGSAIAWAFTPEDGKIAGIDEQGRVSLVHNPGTGTALTDRTSLRHTVSQGGLSGGEHGTDLVVRYRVTDPQEAILWDKILMAYEIVTAAVFPTTVSTTNYPFALTLPPAVAPATRVASFTTDKTFALKTNLETPSGTHLTWRSSDEGALVINNLTGAAAVKPRAEAQVVTITAVLEKDGYSAESPYYLEITVPAAPSTPFLSYDDLYYQAVKDAPFDIRARSTVVVQSCAIDPPLPAGLALTTSATHVCRISGTPTTDHVQTLHVVTATDGGGETGTAELFLSVDTASVTTALANLGVPTVPPPLTDRDGNVLPADYNPLRKRNVSFFNTKEIFGAGENTMMHGLYDSMATTEFGGHAPVALFEFGEAEQWGWITNAVKSGAAADFDGDGYDEVAVVYLKDTGAAVADVVLRTVDDQSGGYADAEYVVGVAEYFRTEGSPVPGQVDVAAGDVDGDGKDELVVALGIRSYADMPDFRTTGPEVWYLSGTGNARVLVLDDAAAGFELLSETTLGWDYARSIYVTAADLAGKGKADHIAVSVMSGNEAWYYIHRYDAVAKTLTVQAAGPVQAMEGETEHRAMLADVTAADFNRNGVPELVFAGVEEPSEARPDTRYVAMAVEYDGSNFRILPGAKWWTDYTSGDWKPGAFAYSGACSESRTCDWVKVLDVFAEVLDVDGDAQPDLLINNKVYTPGFAPKTDVDGAEMSIWGLMNNQNVDMTAYVEGSNPYVGHNPFTAFHRSNTWIAVGDFNGDRREDVAYWGRNRPDGLQVWGVNSTGAFAQLGWYDTGSQTNDNPNRGYPVLLAANVDDDSLVVSYRHSETVFTEPLPIAAVAAASCWADGNGQNLEECTSSFGNASTTTQSSAHTLSAHAGVSLGFQTPLGGLGIFSVAVKGTVTFNSEFTFGTEHSLTKSVMFNSGANEDMVVFMSVPYDVYHYEVIAVPPGGAATIGQDFVVRVPRKPRIRQAERTYYNGSVATISADRVIATETFTHVPGDPLSYPGAAAKAAILALQGGGIENGPVAAPQGGGSTVLALEVNDTTSSSTVLGFDVDIEVETTVMDTLSLGFSVGGGYAYDVSIATTDGSTYEGSIGGIDAANYAARSYDFGIFAYVTRTHPSGFQFHTVNFWVE